MPKTRYGASACLVDDAGRVLLITREKEPFRGMLAFPGGNIEAGENTIDAARRELREETGFAAIGEPFAHVVVENVSGEKTFRIESFAFSKWIAPKSPGELTGEWMTFAAALAARLAPGMDRALREFQRAVDAINKG